MTTAQPTPRTPDNRVISSAWAVVLASLSLAAALIHAAAVSEHSGVSPLAALFAVAAILQGAWAVLVVARPTRDTLAVGLVANLAFITVYCVSRVVAIPVLGIDAAEAVGFQDFTCVLLEGAIFATAGYLLAPRGFVPSFRHLGAIPAAAVLLVVTLVSVPALAAGHGHDEAAHSHGTAEEASVHDHGTVTGAEAAGDVHTGTGDVHGERDEPGPGRPAGRRHQARDRQVERPCHRRGGRVRLHRRRLERLRALRERGVLGDTEDARPRAPGVSRLRGERGRHEAAGVGDVHRGAGHEHRRRAGRRRGAVAHPRQPLLGRDRQADRRHQHQRAVRSRWHAARHRPDDPRLDRARTRAVRSPTSRTALRSAAARPAAAGSPPGSRARSAGAPAPPRPTPTARRIAATATDLLHPRFGVAHRKSRSAAPKRVSGRLGERAGAVERDAVALDEELAVDEVRGLPLEVEADRDAIADVARRRLLLGRRTAARTPRARSSSARPASRRPARPTGCRRGSRAGGPAAAGRRRRARRSPRRRAPAPTRCAS